MIESRTGSLALALVGELDAPPLLAQRRSGARRGAERGAPLRWSSLPARDGRQVGQDWPKLPPCVLLSSTRLELICDELLVTDDVGIVARLDDVRVPGAEFGLRPVVVGYV